MTRNCAILIFLFFKFMVCEHIKSNPGKDRLPENVLDSIMTKYSIKNKINEPKNFHVFSNKYHAANDHFQLFLRPSFISYSVLKPTKLVPNAPNSPIKKNFRNTRIFPKNDFFDPLQISLSKKGSNDIKGFSTTTQSSLLMLITAKNVEEAETNDVNPQSGNLHGLEIEATTISTVAVDRDTINTFNSIQKFHRNNVRHKLIKELKKIEEELERFNNSSDIITTFKSNSIDIRKASFHPTLSNPYHVRTNFTYYSRGPTHAQLKTILVDSDHNTMDKSLQPSTFLTEVPLKTVSQSVASTNSWDSPLQNTSQVTTEPFLVTNVLENQSSMEPQIQNAEILATPVNYGTVTLVPPLVFNLLSNTSQGVNSTITQIAPTILNTSSLVTSMPTILLNGSNVLVANLSNAVTLIPNTISNQINSVSTISPPLIINATNSLVTMKPTLAANVLANVVTLSTYAPTFSEVLGNVPLTTMSPYNLTTTMMPNTTSIMNITTLIPNLNTSTTIVPSNISTTTIMPSNISTTALIPSNISTTTIMPSNMSTTTLLPSNISTVIVPTLNSTTAIVLPNSSTVSLVSTTAVPLNSSVDCVDVIYQCDKSKNFCTDVLLGSLYNQLCPYSCNRCKLPDGCFDTLNSCATLKTIGYCDLSIYTNAERSLYCKKTCALC